LSLNQYCSNSLFSYIQGIFNSTRRYNNAIFIIKEWIFSRIIKRHSIVNYWWSIANKNATEDTLNQPIFCIIKSRPDKWNTLLHVACAISISFINLNCCKIISNRILNHTRNILNRCNYTVNSWAIIYICNCEYFLWRYKSNSLCSTYGYNRITK